MSPHGIGWKQTWCKKIYCMIRAIWLTPLTLASHLIRIFAWTNRIYKTYAINFPMSMVTLSHLLSIFPCPWLLYHTCCQFPMSMVTISHWLSISPMSMVTLSHLLTISACPWLPYETCYQFPLVLGYPITLGNSPKSMVTLPLCLSISHVHGYLITLAITSPMSMVTLPHCLSISHVHGYPITLAITSPMSIVTLSQLIINSPCPWLPYTTLAMTLNNDKVIHSLIKRFYK